jgi:uncharacterized membrane protein SpoIIM required for sporulation/uncharacterized RDD family membrane protein YckC
MPDYRQHLRVETPEHVVLEYEIAGLGSRTLAAVLDALVLGGSAFAGVMALALLSFLGVRLGLSGTWAAVLLIGLGFFAAWGYYALFEGLREGQTPGKRMIGIRVVRDTGHPVTLGAAAARNLVRAVDAFLIPPYFLGALLVALHPRGKRLGDMVAGTVVVRDRPAERAAPAPRAGATGATGATGPAAGTLAAPELEDDEYRVLDRFVARADALSPQVRDRLAADLAARFAEQRHGALAAAGDAAFLAELHVLETARRQGALAARGTGGGGLGDRLAARKRARWDEFAALAGRAAKSGLDALDAAELPDFAARYREIAADLARLRTYRADSATIAHVERLVAAGHNALYRDERHTWRGIWRAVTHDWPAAVVGARGYVLVGFLAFSVPAAVGYRVMREQPALAEELLPETMLQRAAEGAERVAAGRKYVEVSAADRPVAASGIIANNVRVAFLCFAGGELAGVGALFLLAFNGLQIGASAGHFANAGLLGYLLEFILGHGALELFAIWVAGAAGFLLGRSIIAPGELTRGDALVLSGRRAVRMVGAASVCLLVAGLIEGFVSTSGGGLAARWAASAGSLLFLGVYLAGVRRA